MPILFIHQVIYLSFNSFPLINFTEGCLFSWYFLQTFELGLSVSLYDIIFSVCVVLPHIYFIFLVSLVPVCGSFPNSENIAH